MAGGTRRGRFRSAVSIVLISIFMIGTDDARALAPVISTVSKISNGAIDPAILVIGSNFATSLNKFGFTVDVGTTGLTFDSVAFVALTKIRVNLRGTAKAGSISIQANISVFNPVADSLSNTLTITVPDPIIAQTISFDALKPMVVNDSDQILSASSTSGLEVSFITKTPAICKIISQKIQALAAGNCAIKASQSGNSTYQAAPDVVNSVAISVSVSGVVEKPVAGVTAEKTFATYEYSPLAPNMTLIELIISSNGIGQFGSTKLKLLVPSGATKEHAVFLVSSYSSGSENDQGFFVARIEVVDKFGTALNRVERAYEINMPKGYSYSEQYWSSDGLLWQRIPETKNKSLPTDSHAAFFREIDGSVSILTDQLGLFGYRFPQTALEVISPASKIILNSQIQLSSVGGSGTGELVFGTTTSQVCTVTSVGVLTGKQAGACFIFARKIASAQYIDSLSKKIIITVQGTTRLPTTQGATIPDQSTCSPLSYSLTSLDGQVLANFCPQDVGKVAILYVRSASSTRKWRDKKVSSVVIDSLGVAVFQVAREISASRFLHVFVNGQHRL